MINGIHRDTWGHKARCFVRVMLLAIGMIWSMQINAQTKDYFKFTALKDNSIVELQYTPYSPGTIKLWTSVDHGVTWIVRSGPFIVTLSNMGDELWIKGMNKTSFSKSDNQWAFGGRCKGKLAVSGNIMSIVDSTLNTKEIPSGSGYYFMKLFDQNTALVDASGLVLPAKELPNDCYHYMFRNCSNLTKGPDMSMVKVIGGASCMQMFMNCTTMVAAPNMPDLITVKEKGCEYMYSGCKALTTVPSLTAQTILEYGYHQMFNGCTALEKAPSILATEITEANALQEMFNGCSALKFIEVYFTEWNENATKDWTKGVPTGTDGVFSAPCTLPDKRNSGSDYSYIPQNWKFVCFSQDCTDVEATLEDSTPICEDPKSGE